MMFYQKSEPEIRRFVKFYSKRGGHWYFGKFSKNLGEMVILGNRAEIK